MASISRLDPTPSPANQRHHARQPVVHARRLLRLLGIESADLGRETLTVQARGLRLLLQQLGRMQPFDPEFYAETYPDIEAARLSGIVADLHEHFVTSGFIEGRLPSEPPFDPVWYAQYYPDLSQVIAAHDVVGLRNHFITSGLAEGRAGTAATLPAAESWQQAE